ncbi:MAG: class B sortase [Anaerovoracaceae bacterium]|jgi:sortase B
MKKKIYKIIFVICIAVFLFSAGNLIKYHLASTAERNHLEELARKVAPSEADDPSPLPGYKKLHQENTDMIGWIKVDNTRISYPVMQTKKDPEYYLRRNFDKEYSISGLPFLDASCNLSPPSTNLIIYGHHMKNGTMFFDLLKYEEEDFWVENPTFAFDLIDREQRYQVVAAFYSKIYPKDSRAFRYYTFMEASDEKAFDDYIKEIKSLSLYDTGIIPSFGDQLLTLSTCSYHTKNGRFAILARKIS